MNLFMYVIQTLFAVLYLYASVNIRYLWLVKAGERAWARLNPRPTWFVKFSLGWSSSSPKTQQANLNLLKLGSAHLQLYLRWQVIGGKALIEIVVFLQVKILYEKQNNTSIQLKKGHKPHDLHPKLHVNKQGTREKSETTNSLTRHRRWKKRESERTTDGCANNGPLSGDYRANNSKKFWTAGH